MKLRFGLTDEECKDTFAQPDPDDPDNTTYGLIKNNSAIEKTFISWTLNENLPAVKSVIELYENISTSKYASTVIVTGEDTNNLNPEFKEHSFSVNVFDMFPISSDLLHEYQDQDYDEMYVTPVSGALYLSKENAANYIEEMDDVTLDSAIDAGYLDDFDPSVKLYAVPCFETSFFLGGPPFSDFYKRKHQTTAKKILNDFAATHSDKLQELGVNIADYYNKIGRVHVGTLDQDLREAYEAVSKYSRICSVSLIGE